MIDLILESSNLKDYLAEDHYVDFSHLVIREKVKELFRDCESEVSKIKKAFEFVRDEIAHSWDIQSTRITKRASEAMMYKEGICYAKSNLFAALLRSINIPAGFCYQRLTIGNTPETGYCIHALNAVYISEINKWIRLDTRGNKEGINAQFSIDTEQLAFPVRHYYDEKDYTMIYKEPNKKTIEVLNSNENCLEMYKYNLPTKI
ncbi:transglutaminase superfamily protein [Natranaerovirga pectinivora]|uniref:Transglutaminase superfamily protein n=1 Tax=Natranaerovirga pectinivora TaxID=682400 RepID=A0A4R3MRT5_9FIRM|nr:transglutaminase family protein [Natranaerovirga pectinivora]TCT17223.1 transglutaminase superfamily protein [Natranaerovirga pectinivora]